MTDNSDKIMTELSLVVLQEKIDELTEAFITLRLGVSSSIELLRMILSRLDTSPPQNQYYPSNYPFGTPIGSDSIPRINIPIPPINPQYDILQETLLKLTEEMKEDQENRKNP